MIIPVDVMRLDKREDWDVKIGWLLLLSANVLLGSCGNLDINSDISIVLCN